MVSTSTRIDYGFGYIPAEMLALGMAPDHPTGGVPLSRLARIREIPASACFPATIVASLLEKASNVVPSLVPADEPVLLAAPESIRPPANDVRHTEPPLDQIGRAHV